MELSSDEGKLVTFAKDVLMHSTQLTDCEIQTSSPNVWILL